MKILITGGLGFVGGRIAQSLLANGHNPVVTTRLLPPKAEMLPGIKVIHIDWNSIDKLREVCTGFDCIIHAAGINSRASQEKPAEALAFNGVGTARLAEASVLSGCQRFFYLSTAHVYGSPLQGRLDESSCPANYHPYATSHRAGEDAVLYSRKTAGPGYTVLRLSNAFGAPSNAGADCWQLLVNDLCRQAVESRRMVLHTSGKQQRDFIPLSDVCKLVEYMLSGPTSVLPPVINVCVSRAMPVIGMAKLIHDRCQVVLGYTPAFSIPSDDGNTVTAEPLLLESTGFRAIGFSPENNIVEEVDALLNFCQQQFQ